MASTCNALPPVPSIASCNALPPLQPLRHNALQLFFLTIRRVGKFLCKVVATGGFAGELKSEGRRLEVMAVA